MRKIKIDIITGGNQSKRGGAYLAAKRISKLLKKKFIINFICVDKISRLSIIKYYFARILVFIFLKKGNYLNSLNFFTRIDLKKIKGDIVHLNWIGEEAISLKDINKIQKPIIWTMHDMWPATTSEHYLEKEKKIYLHDNFKNNFLKKIIYNQKKNIFKKKITLVPNSMWLEKFAKKSLISYDSNIKKIYNPVEINFWKRRNYFYSLQKLGLEKNKNYILFGADGGLKSYRKGGDLFLKIINNIKLEKKYEFIVLGGKENCIKEINNIKIHFRKFENSEVRQLMYHSIATLTLSTSRMDSLPQFILETVLTCNPVVAFDIGGLNELVVHKQNGYLVNNFNIREYCNGINYCIKNIKKFDLKNYRNLIKEKFNNKIILNEYSKIIEKLCATENIINFNKNN